MGLTPVEFSLVDAGGWIAVVGTVVLSMIRGWLVPGRTVDRLVDSYRELLTDKDQQIVDWREAARTEAKRGDLLAQNQQQMLTSLKTTHELVRTVRDVVGGPGV